MLVTNPNEFKGSINLNSIFKIQTVVLNEKKFLALDGIKDLCVQNQKGIGMELVGYQNLKDDINSTHSLKLFLQDAVYEKVKEALGGNTPFVGNLTDWAKQSKFKEKKEIDTSYFNLEIYLNNLIGVLKTDDANMIYIPIEENNIIKGVKGYYLNFIGYPNKIVKKHTHYLKLSVNKDVYANYTEDEKKKIPIIGDAKEEKGSKKVEIPKVLASDFKIISD